MTDKIYEHTKVKKALYKMILFEIRSYRDRLCKDYIFGKIMGSLQFAANAGIISYESRFAIEDFIDRKVKYLDRGGII